MKNTTFRAPAISQNVTKCCACHEKSHSNFSKYCAWHERCTLLFSTLFSLGIYSLLASIPSWHLFPLLCLPRKVTLQLQQILRLARKMHSTLLYSILSWHLFSLGIYSLLASILSWHLFSLGIYSLGIYSLLASILSWHLFSLGIYSLLASIL